MQAAWASQKAPKPRTGLEQYRCSSAFLAQSGIIEERSWLNAGRAIQRQYIRRPLWKRPRHEARAVAGEG
jgi:hypothetical protein